MLKKQILVDENMMRIFSRKWLSVREELEKRGYHLLGFPAELKGESDRSIIQYVIKCGLDGLITEDTDYFETHRSNLLWGLLDNGKILLAVRRVNPNMPRGEVRVYEYTRYGKTELFRLVIDY